MRWWGEKCSDGDDFSMVGKLDSGPFEWWWSECGGGSAECRKRGVVVRLIKGVSWERSGV